MIRYRPLLAVDIAHDYFLSRGDVVFEAQADAERTALSRLYSVGDFLEVFPDDATRSVLAGYKMLFRATDTGFVVSVRLDPSASDTAGEISRGRSSGIARRRRPAATWRCSTSPACWTRAGS